MNKTYQRINWQNEPSIATPLNEVNLNKVDYSLNEVDNRVITLDTTKANQSDLLQTVKTVTYNTTTGVFTFTFWNGTTVTADLNIEKIPVSFSMSPQGVITMTTADGTQYTADVSELIKTYSFVDSTEIDFTVETDQSGNKNVTASIKAGSITGEKLQPNYLADCVSAKQNAELAAGSASGSATSSELSSEDSEAWAVGERNGQPVPSTDPAYENNAKWWAQHGTGSSFAGLTDTNFTNLQNGQIAKYDSQSGMWINTEDEGGLLPHFKITSEAGSTVTVVLPDGVTTITPTQTSSGIWQCDVPAYGVYTVHAVINSDDAVRTVTVDTVKEYVIHDEHYSYTLNVYAPTGSSILVTDGGSETYTGTGAGSTAVIFALHQASTTYTITVTIDGLSQTQTITSSATTGGSGSKTFEFGTINVTLGSDFIGEIITCTKGQSSTSKTASTTSLIFYPNETGTWTISGEVSGTVYTVDAVVSSLSTSVSVTLESVPNGSTVTPTDDIQTWLACAEITDKSYTTLLEVLSDATTYQLLVANSNACKYMARSTTWASTLVADEPSMHLLGRYDYACDTLLNNATWAEAIAGSSYVDYVLDISVPKMTSATTPSGTVIASGENSATNARWKAFDGDSSTSWAYSGSYPMYIGYTFNSPVCCKFMKFISINGDNEPKAYKVQASNDGFVSDIHDLLEVSLTSHEVSGIKILNNSSSYTSYRVLISTAWVTNAGSIYYTLQFYGRHESSYIQGKVAIHGARSSSIYYKDGGSDVSIGTTDSSTGIASVNISDMPLGTYSMYDGVAKEPSDLSIDYSRTVTITRNTTDVYLMPDGALYWWGWMSSELEECSTANGWGISSSYSYVAPTYNTNNIYCNAAANKIVGVGKKTPLSATKAVTVYQNATSNSGGILCMHTTKTTDSQSTYVEPSKNGTYAFLDTTNYQNQYFTYTYNNGRIGYIKALWYE